jgi:hypothetical protein
VEQLSGKSAELGPGGAQGAGSLVGPEGQGSQCAGIQKSHAELGPRGARGAGIPAEYGSRGPKWSWILARPKGWGAWQDVDLEVLHRPGAWWCLSGREPGRVEQWFHSCMWWGRGGPADF